MEHALFQQFTEKLRVQLQKTLPGEMAQYRMAPAVRRSREQGHPAHSRPSSVLILLYPHANVIRTVFILRTDNAGVHSGQVSFPGGKFEEQDRYLHITALRETAEEIGYTAQESNLLGNLSPLYIPVSNYLVHPFVFFSPEKPVFTPNAREVKQIIEVDLDLLTAEATVQSKKIRHSNGAYLHTPYYNINGYTIWGATAMITSEFTAVLKETGFSAS